MIGGSAITPHPCSEVMVASHSRPSAASINAVLPMRADDVDVSAGVHEYGGDVGVVAGGGDHESRVARIVGRVDVGTMGKQPATRAVSRVAVALSRLSATAVPAELRFNVPTRRWSAI